MATAQEIQSIRLWSAALSKEAVSTVSDARIDEILETYRPLYGLSGRLTKVAAIEVCEILATWHADNHPEEANRYNMRAVYLRNLPAFQVASTTAPTEPATRHYLWNRGAVPSVAEIQAGVTDPNITTAAGAGFLTFWVWSSQPITRITAASAFDPEGNLLDTFDERPYQVAGQAGHLYSTQLVAGAINTRWQVS